MKISGANKFIANLSLKYGLEGVPNGIQIWRVDRKQNKHAEPIFLSKHVEIDQQIWVPIDFYRESGHSLILKVAAIGKYMNENGQLNENDFYYLRLQI